MFTRIFSYLLIITGLSFSAFAADKVAVPVDANVENSIEKNVEEFKQSLIKDHGFEKAYLDKWFATTSTDKGILKTISRPAEAAMPWHKYRNIFIQQERVDKGLIFWDKYADTLARAEKTFGVPAEVIVGLIGVETKYGRIKGKHDVFNALYTLGFHFPRRSKFFKKELKEFLILAREQQWSVGEIKGSYAGAMGYGQFMPSSYRFYAVDFDDDGKIDLIDNPVDAIGSVANYVKKHGWKKDGELIFKANVSGDGYKALLQKSLKPKTTVGQFSAAGIHVDAKLDAGLKAVLIELQQVSAKEYWLGLENFYVISRYNPRKLYTMAVVQLTGMIKEQYLVKQASVTQ